MATAYKSMHASAFGADYPFVLHETLRSSFDQYEVLEYLGRGTFSQVVKCRKKSTNQTVAVKIFKNHPSCSHQGRVEVTILHRLAQGSADKRFHFVRPFDCFLHKSHTCLVIEMLALSLHDFLKQNRFSPLPLMCIRPVLMQVLMALLELKRLGIIHADLKPQNIMLVDPERQPFRVKIIDFGCSSFASAAIGATYVQSRYYRAPEVILGLPFNEAIDMWSLGCAMAELFLAWPLYPGSSEYDQIRCIIHTQGQPEQHVLDAATKTPLFFCREYESGYPYWRLKSPQEHEAETGIRSKEWRKFVLNSLDDLAHVNVPHDLEDIELLAEQADRRAFVHLLKHILSVEPEHRIDPGDALNHCFFNFGHLVNYLQCENVRASVKLMEAFWFPDATYAPASTFAHGPPPRPVHPMQTQASRAASSSYRAHSIAAPSSCACGMVSPDGHATPAAMAWRQGSPSEAFPLQQHPPAFHETPGHVMLLSPAGISPTGNICTLVPSLWNPVLDGTLVAALSTGSSRRPFLMPSATLFPNNGPMAVFPLVAGMNAWGQAVFFTMNVLHCPTNTALLPGSVCCAHSGW